MFKSLTSTALVMIVVATAPLTGSAGRSGTGTSPAPAPAAPTAPPAGLDVDAPPELPTLTPNRADLVDWARHRFNEAGLELPDVDIRFDPSRELCKQAQGLYEHLDPGHRITICTMDGDSFGAELWTRRTLLHELGHVWDEEHLTDVDRDALLDRFGLDAWIDGDDPWERRGIEHFAEIMVFGLLDQPRRQLEVDLDCPAAAEAFEAVTGQPPLGPGLPWCVEPTA